MLERPRRKMVRGGLALCALLLSATLTGCGPAAAPAAGTAPAAATGASTAAVAPAAAPAPRLESIQLSYPIASACCLPAIAARYRSFFEQNGLDAELLLMSNDRAMPAMASGELRYVGGVGTTSVAASAQGLPVRAVWISASTHSTLLFSRPEITAIEQLRDKRVAVAGLGNTGTLGFQVGLKRSGIDPEREVVLAQFTAEELRLEGLRNGAVDASLLSASALVAEATRDGYRLLADVGNFVPMPIGGLTVSLDTLANQRDQARRVIRALDQAQQWILANREETILLIMDAWRTDRATAEATYEEAYPAYQGKGLVSREGIDNILQGLRDLGRIGPEVRYEDVADGQLAEEVARELGLLP